MLRKKHTSIFKNIIDLLISIFLPFRRNPRTDRFILSEIVVAKLCLPTGYGNSCGNWLYSDSTVCKQILVRNFQSLKSIIMKRQLLIFIAIITSFTSCVQLPDINPESSENIIESLLGNFVPFNERPFTLNVDINKNGTTDFVFTGYTYDDPILGTINKSKIVGFVAGNMVTQKIVEHQTMCNMLVETSPVQLLGPNFSINSLSKWGRSATFYINIQSPSGCENYNDFVGWEGYEYFGIKFIDQGQIFYGYLNIKAFQNNYGGDLLGCPDAYRIMNAGYNSNAGQGLRVPG